jgi:urease alpha subunit
MSDGSKAEDINDTLDEPETRTARLRRRLSEWQIRQQIARGLAYGVGSGAVNLLVLWAQARY